MDISNKLMLGYKLSKRSLLKNCFIAFNIIKQFRLKNHEPDVDQISIKVALLAESINDAILADFNDNLGKIKKIYNGISEALEKKSDEGKEIRFRVG